MFVRAFEYSIGHNRIKLHVSQRYYRSIVKNNFNKMIIKFNKSQVYTNIFKTSPPRYKKTVMFICFIQ